MALSEICSKSFPPSTKRSKKSRTGFSLSLFLRAREKSDWLKPVLLCPQGTQLFHAAQLGEIPCPQCGYEECSDASHNHSRDSAEPLRGDARFELADFVRSADEDHFHGAHAPPHLIRRGELH